MSIKSLKCCLFFVLFFVVVFFVCLFVCFGGFFSKKVFVYIFRFVQVNCKRIVST